jgi:hypothetical protein
MDLYAQKERARRVAAGQAGRIAYAQLLVAGLSLDEVRGWIRRGELIRRRRGVYALGHEAPGYEALLWEVDLWTGPGACLTGASAAHWREFLKYRPEV